MNHIKQPNSIIFLSISLSTLLLATTIFSSTAFADETKKSTKPSIERTGFYFQLGGGMGSTKLSSTDTTPQKTPTNQSPPPQKTSKDAQWKAKPSLQFSEKSRTFWPSLNIGLGLGLANFVTIGGSIDTSFKNNSDQKQADIILRAVANLDFFISKFLIGVEGGYSYYYVLNTNNLGDFSFKKNLDKIDRAPTFGASSGFEFNLGNGLALDLRAYYARTNFTKSKVKFDQFGLKALFRWY